MSELSDFLKSEGYFVTPDGRVRSLRGAGDQTPRELKLSEDKDGYLQIGLHTKYGKKTFKVHALVAEYHLPQRPSPFHEVRHLDGSRKNNNVLNLAWGTKAENCADRSAHRAKASPFCRNGHPRNGDNFRAGADGTMRCLTCDRERSRLYYKRSKLISADRQEGRT